jgi:hypothetical protein
MSLVVSQPPIIPKAQPVGRDVTGDIQALRSQKSLPGVEYIARIGESLKQRIDAIDLVLRRTPPPLTEFGVLSPKTGKDLLWVGDKTINGRNYYGIWARQAYFGQDGPETSPFFFGEEGEGIIGRNGYLSIEDIGEHEVGRIGVETEAPLNITGATNATPVVITIIGHGYEDGDTLLIAAVGGNTAANGYRLVQNATTDTFEITDLDGVDIAGNGVYTSGGTATRYFGGARFETFAIGDSWDDYKLRLFRNGRLKIRNADITLEGTDATIVFDPDLGLIRISGNDITTEITSQLDEGQYVGVSVKSDLDQTRTNIFPGGILSIGDDGNSRASMVGDGTGGNVRVFNVVAGFPGVRVEMYGGGDSLTAPAVGIDGGIDMYEGTEFRLFDGATNVKAQINETGASFWALDLDNPLALTEGGTGATSASGARSTLSLYSISEVDTLLANYYTKSEVDGLLLGKASVIHGHSASSTSNHTHGGAVPGDGGHTHLIS